MDYAQISSLEARQLIRAGKWSRPTAGLALGYVQANLVILPQSWAEEFATFCRFNPRAAPLLDVTAPGDPRPIKVASQADVRTDIPRYRVYHHGQLVAEPENLLSVWREDFVAFLIGCTFSWEQELIEDGIRLRHIEQGKNVAMYRTTIACASTARLHGSMVVSMRPIKTANIEKVVEVTGKYPLAHGAPVYIGDPATLGIRDLMRPDWGDAVMIEEDEVPVYWACGVTPQAIIMETRPEIAITHSPGHMFITDWLASVIRQRPPH